MNKPSPEYLALIKAVENVMNDPRRINTNMITEQLALQLSSALYKAQQSIKKA